MSKKIESFRDLRVWREGIELVKATYALTRSLSKDELYGLSSQIRRAAVSIPANIAEGHGRHHIFVIVSELGYCKNKEVKSVEIMGDQVGKMLRKLKQSLQAISTTQHPTPKNLVSLER